MVEPIWSLDGIDGVDGINGHCAEIYDDDACDDNDVHYGDDYYINDGDNVNAVVVDNVNAVDVDVDMNAAVEEDEEDEEDDEGEEGREGRRKEKGKGRATEDNPQNDEDIFQRIIQEALNDPANLEDDYTQGDAEDFAHFVDPGCIPTFNI